MKKITSFAVAALLCANAYGAEDFTTAGNGTAYTLDVLASTDGSGVTKDGTTYVLLNNITIATGDSFVCPDGGTIKMGDGVQIRIEGSASFAPENRVLITRNAETDAPKGIMMLDEVNRTTFKNIDFEYAGLRNFSSTGFDVENCSFRYNNGANTSSGALTTGTGGSSYTVKDCVFEYNTVPAIGGAANYFCGIVIDNCTFVDNNTANTNKPQVNLTVGGEGGVVVKNSTFTGAQRSMVGAISTSNFMGLEGGNVLIENNDIRGHRYGITALGGQSMKIINNKIIDNKYDTNPMNGGSGISLYDSTGALEAVITGNEIADNFWGITVIGACKSVNVGYDDELVEAYNPGHNIFRDNANNGTPYDLYNNSTITVYAQGNKWSVESQTAELIETVIFHKVDNPSLGEVIFTPAWDGGAVKTITSECDIRFFNNKIVAPTKAIVEVFALNGAKVAHINAIDGIVDLSSLAKGSYIARLTMGEKASVVKCIVR